MAIFKGNAKEEDHAVSSLIEEQREKESIEVWRRAWCVSEAVMLDDATQDNLLKIADKIHEYVYGRDVDP